MAYRNGTYIAFHANGQREPTESDIKYYNLLCAWKVNEDCNLTFTNSHDKNSALRDNSKRETVRRALTERLRNSKNMVLIIGETTREDTDWVPLEISYAVDACEIPIIAAYPGYVYVRAPQQLAHLWPEALASRIRDGKAHVIHVPFKQEPLTDAIPRFSHEDYPLGGGLGRYSDDAYREWGLL